MEAKLSLYEDKYEIIEVSKEEMYKINEARGKEDRNYYPYGITSHHERKIFINEEICDKEKERTLVHELMHAWMYITANAYQENYNEEHICEMVAASNQLINDIVNEYMQENKMVKIKNEIDEIENVMKEVEAVIQ